MSHPETATAKDINACAADWLQRREFWDWGAEDQTALDEWLSQSWAHRVAYHRLELAWGRADRLVALRTCQREDDGSAEGGAGRFVLRAAAAFVLFAVIGGAAALYTWQPKAKAYSTAKGERETLSLSDGSQIELNTDTSLRILATGAERQVWLDRGEAYFEVTHDAKRPFTVWVAGKRVTDIGTKFVILRKPERMELSVMEGRVGVANADDPNPERGLKLSKGEMLVATANSTSVTHQSLQAMSSDFSWLHGMLVFDDAPLSKVVAEFSRYSSEKIVIADPAAAETRVSATFPINGVEDFVKLAHRVLGLQVERRNGEIVISRP